MGVQEVMSWYQKKIGTYDKQQWERTIEQRILHGLTHVPKKTARLKTELIDVDLVRGSSFPKAKPKHGLVTVTRLACQRLFLLPLYSRWWIQQTSPRVYMLLLFLYILQLSAIGIFFCCCSVSDDGSLEGVSASEVLVPAAMMFILSIIHSQIVSTHIGPARQLSHIRPRKNNRSRRQQGSRSRTWDSVGSEKLEDVDHINSKYSKRVRLRRCSSDDIRRRSVARETSKSKKRTDSINTKQSVSAPINNPEGLPLRINVQAMADIDNRRQREATPLDDDGFESLTGNGSSENGEEVVEEGDESTNAGSDISQMPSNKKGSRNMEHSRRSALNLNQDEKQPPDKSNVPEISEEPHTATTSSTPCSSNLASNEVVNSDVPFRNVWVHRHSLHPDGNHADNETDGSDTETRPLQRVSQVQQGVESSCNSSCESESPGGNTGCCCPLLTEGTTSAGEWMAITTNSEDCSCSSDLDETESRHGGTEMNDHPFAWEFGLSSSVILSPSSVASDKVSCTMWESHDVKKADLSVLDISSAIIARVENMPENLDYFYGGIAVSLLLALLPSICRLSSAVSQMATAGVDDPVSNISTTMLPMIVPEVVSSMLGQISTYLVFIMETALGNTFSMRIVVLIAMFDRCVLAIMFFFLLAVAERTFKQRFLYAKLFSHLTSFRRARKSELPHFRLNKVRNIKTWLSVRSYLKKRGPQRSVDVIVSAAFLITLLLLSFLSVECLKDSVRLHSQYNMEALTWCFVLGIFLLRFMTLGTKINRKYRNLSVLITEQINLYLQIEQKPNKKEELMVANSVLKLAADLLKELESPFKISGLSANPYLYTITKVVILSALSGVLSEMLGFKLKLHKIKIK